MDYKQKYEDALKIAKEICRSYPLSDTTKVVCEEIFPELKESEDERNERIRKALKSYFNSEISDYGNIEWVKGIRYGEVIAWLEKQGEKKSTKWSEEDIAIIESIIASMKCGYKSSIGQEKWLKSLKQRMKGE